MVEPVTHVSCLCSHNQPPMKSSQVSRQAASGSRVAAHRSGCRDGDTDREELPQKQAETPRDPLAILPRKLQISESYMQDGREAALFLLERGGGVCVRDGHQSNLLVFLCMAELGNEVAIPK